MRIKRIGKSREYRIQELEEVTEDKQMRVEIWNTKTVHANELPCRNCPHRKN